MTDAFAARPTAGIDREAAARIIDPEEWALDDFAKTRGKRAAFIGKSLTKADAILALFPTPAKTGERGAVIEECARYGQELIDSDELAEMRRQLGGGCAANTGGDHTVIKQGQYAFCGDCGESLRGVRYCHLPALSQPLPDAPIVSGEGSV